MSQKPQPPTPASVDQQLQAVLALAEINRQAREGLRARFVERQARPTANGRPFTMRGLALEVGCSWEFVRHVHDGSKAFGVSNSGDRVIEYLKLEKEWGPVKAVCSEAALADSMVSIALFPATIIVLPKDAPRIRIQDTVFWLKQYDGPGEPESAMFAYFRSEGVAGEGHVLTINAAHPRMLRAGERGAEHVRRVFVQEVAMRYAQFLYQRLRSEEAQALEAEGAHILIRKVAEVALTVMDTLLS